MSSVGGNRRASRAVEVTSADVTRPAIEAPAAVSATFRVTRKGGGVVLEELAADGSVARSRPPEALAIVAARLQGLVAERFSR